MIPVGKTWVPKKFQQMTPLVYSARIPEATWTAMPPFGRYFSVYARIPYHGKNVALVPFVGGIISFDF